jgi:hypothetical protein
MLPPIGECSNSHGLPHTQQFHAFSVNVALRLAVICKMQFGAGVPLHFAQIDTRSQANKAACSGTWVNHVNFDAFHLSSPKIALNVLGKVANNCAAPAT